MLIETIVQRVNKKLAGERLDRYDLDDLADATIDDINVALSSKFPVFSEWSDYVTERNAYITSVGGIDPVTGKTLTLLDATKYTAFPEKYIRAVLIPGMAYKFNIQDEEGERVASEFYTDYQKGLAIMQRDYIESVPAEFIDESGGYVTLQDSDERDTEVLFNGDNITI